MNIPNLKMEVGVLSEKGLREENQDWLGWKQIFWGELFIVADGMGGYKGGAEASRMTVEGIEKKLSGILSHDLPFDRALQQAVQETNAEIYRDGHGDDPEKRKMGSTVVVALVSDGKVQVGHIGDSRAYLVRKGRLQALTRDHTAVQKMLDAKILSPKEARNHPEGHILSRALGSNPEVEIELGEPIPLEEGDALLLCSDGLSGSVEDKQIEKALRKHQDVQDVPSELVNLALASGSNDNITIQFVKFGGSEEHVRAIGGLSFRLSQNKSRGAGLVVAAVCAGLVAVVVHKHYKGVESGASARPSAAAADNAAINTNSADSRHPTGIEENRSAPAAIQPQAAAAQTAGVNPVRAAEPEPPVEPAPDATQSTPLEILILMRTEQNRTQADFLKTQIEGSLNRKVRIIGPKIIAGLKPEAWIYYAGPELDNEAKGLAIALKQLKAGNIPLDLKDIDKHRGPYKTRKALQTFAEDNVSPGTKRHLLVLLPEG